MNAVLYLKIADGSSLRLDLPIDSTGRPLIPAKGDDIVVPSPWSRLVMPRIQARVTRVTWNYNLDQVEIRAKETWREEL